MKFSIKLTLINTCITIVLILTITGIVLMRSARLQQETALEQLTALSIISAKDVWDLTDVCMQFLEAIRLSTWYDQSTPPDFKRAELQNILTMLIVNESELVSAHTVWLPDAFDGMDAAYIGTPGATESGQFALLVSKTSSSAVEVKTYEDYRTALADMPPSWTISNPTLYTINGTSEYTVELRVPAVFDERVVGLIGLQVRLNGARIITEREKPYGTGYAALYANDGTVVTHNDPAKIGKNFRDADAELLGATGVSAVIRASRDGTSEAFINNNMAIVIGGFAGIVTKPITNPWTFVFFVPLDTVLAPVHSLIGFSVVFLIIAGLVAAIAIFLTSNNLARRIIRVRDMVKNIAEGEGDLTRRLTIYAQDEIGSMGTYFNETLDKIHSMMWTVKDRSTNLAMIGAELSANMTETAATVNEIATTIQQVHKQVNNQAGSVSQTDKTMQKIAASIEQLNTHLETQAESVNQCSVAIEEMLANIASVTQTLIKNDENVKKLSQASEAGRTGLEEVSIDIQEIAKESQGLLEITAVLENIASQTNLLSMNAAIEAAHAGESGKGFTVVAEEIRKLAESSSEQSKTIAAVLKKIKGSIDTISVSADGVIERFEMIDRSVKTVSEQESAMRNSMEEQGIGSQRVMEYISKLNDITRIIKEDSGDMRNRNREVIEESRKLDMLTQEINRGMQEMASGAEQINIAVHRVNDLSGETKQYIDGLAGEISKFKVAE